MPCHTIGPKLFWTGTNCFGQVQIRLFWANFYNLDLSKMIWTRPKQIRHVQNEWYSTKMIWTVINHFGPIEEQGIREFISVNLSKSWDCFLNQFINYQSDPMIVINEHTCLTFLEFLPIILFSFHVKFGYSEKATKFEKVFHLKFDATQ